MRGKVGLCTNLTNQILFGGINTIPYNVFVNNTEDKKIKKTRTFESCLDKLSNKNRTKTCQKKIEGNDDYKLNQCIKPIN